jgi:hypothetical protein
MKRWYRVPFDWIEEVTTGLADAIVVNSLFTKGVFKEAFPRIEKSPDVVYPCVDINPTYEPIPEDNPLVTFLRYSLQEACLILDLAVSFYLSTGLRGRRMSH